MQTNNGGLEMEEILKFLQDGAIGAFATVDNGKPRVRPWQFSFEEEGKLYFCTANNKDVYKQLQENPYAEFSSTNSEMVTIRVGGKVNFTDDINIKQKLIDKLPGIKDIYQSGDNPIFEVFYIEHGEVIIADFSGQPPKNIAF